MTTRSIATIAFIVGVLWGTPTMAFREEFMTRVNGQRVVGSTVCFFPASDDDGFMKKFLSSSDVRCLSADAILDMPAGRWNIFAVNGSEYVNVHPEFYEAFGQDDFTYGRISINLVPAGRLDLTAIATDLVADERLVVYFPNDDRPESPATVRPLIKGETSLLVPGDVPVVPLIVKDGLPIEAVGVFRVAKGQRLTAPKYRRSGTDIFALIRLNSPDMRKATTKAPDVVIESKDGTRTSPLLPIRGGFSIDRSLAIFRSPKPGASRVMLSGAGWRSDAIDVTIGAGTHVLPRPLQAHPVAEVTVAWSVRPATLTALTMTERVCGNSANELARKPSPPPTLHLLKCADKINPNVSACTAVEERAFRLSDGTGKEVFQVEAGRYAAEMFYGDLRAASDPVDVELGGPHVLQVIDDAHILNGTVRRGTRRISARLMFQSGEALALDDGQFIAALSRPAAGTITVHPCDGSEFYDDVLLEPITTGNVDITIPDNVVKVSVVDATTGSPMKGVRVTAAPMKGSHDEDAAYFIERMTNSSGVATYRQVPTALPLQICATDPGRAHGCVNVDALHTDALREVTIRLTPEERREGRIFLGAPIVAGKVFIVSGDGTLAEAALVNPDGTFRYHAKFTPADYVVVVSASHPLFVAQPQAKDDESVVIGMPQGGTRTFEVRLEDVEAKGTITVAVGGLLVPADAFAAHQLARNRQNNLYGTAPLLVTDVLESAPLSVILGPLARQDLMNRTATAVAFPRMPVTPLVTFSAR